MSNNESDALDNLYTGTISIQWRVVAQCSLEINNYHFGFVHIHTFTPSLYIDSLVLLMSPSIVLSLANEPCIALQSLGPGAQYGGDGNVAPDFV